MLHVLFQEGNWMDFSKIGYVPIIFSSSKLQCWVSWDELGVGPARISFHFGQPPNAQKTPKGNVCWESRTAGRRLERAMFEAILDDDNRSPKLLEIPEWNLSRLWMSHTQTMTGLAVTLKKHFEVMSQIPHSIFFYTAETASVWSAKNRATMPLCPRMWLLHTFTEHFHMLWQNLCNIEQLYQVGPPWATVSALGFRLWRLNQNVNGIQQPFAMTRHRGLSPPVTHVMWQVFCKVNHVFCNADDSSCLCKTCRNDSTSMCLSVTVHLHMVAKRWKINCRSSWIILAQLYGT